MHAQRFKVTVPKQHHLSLDVPEQLTPGPAEVIVLATSLESRRIVWAGGVLSPEGPLPDGGGANPVSVPMVRWVSLRF